jgi:hypothetical protein
MALSNFISKLNWRLLVLHFIACWFLIYSFLMFSYIHDNELFIDLLNHPKDWMTKGRLLHVDPSRMSNDTLWVILSKYIGLLTGFLISLILAIKKHWHWLNSLIVFLISILLLRFHLLGWNYLSQIFTMPGALFKKYGIGYFLINGSVMLAIGLLLFFLKWSVQFIKPVGLSDKQNTPIS